MLVLFSRDLHIFSPHWKRCLLENLIFRGRWHIYMLVLFFPDLQTFPSCWKRRPWLGILIFEVNSTFVCLFSPLEIFRYFLLVERDSIDLECWCSRSRARLCLFCSLGIFNHLSSLLEEKVLIWRVFVLKRENLIWGRVFNDSSSP